MGEGKEDEITAVPIDNDKDNDKVKDTWSSFYARASAFVEATEQLVQEGVNPGGYYKAVWCRDASYILKDWFLSGRFEDVMHELLFIWSHQIAAEGEKVIYGRGSPETQYVSQVAGPEVHTKFQGALPSTIFHGFSEVYGKDPDIDSTALMISTTAWIFDAYLKSGMATPLSSLPARGGSSATSGELKMSSVVSEPSVVIEYIVPRMLKAMDYLASRDIDGDGLLEQGYNEDWMDTVLRSGKIVYSQACWILALGNLSSLLAELGKDDEAKKAMSMAHRTINATEDLLWSEKDGTYLDLQQDTKGRALTQDISLYLVAATENALLLDGGRSQSLKKNEPVQGKSRRPEFFDGDSRANRALDVLKARIWKDRWPLVTEAALERTGPWVLDPNQYHNHTFWPWTTGIEMLARSRLQRIDECHTLLSMLSSKDSQSNIRAFCEWVNPVTDMGFGAHPFRTGISAIRIAIIDMLCQMDKKQQV
ncbi:MAG TPA: GH116 family glycosyl hydrolase [Nitrososphaera sp.]|nr:GH116 family glycosyl hydrolase [Nitrososphaera sp.]